MLNRRYTWRGARASERSKSLQRVLRSFFIKFLCVLLALVLLAGGAIALSERLGGPLPTWQTIYRRLGFRYTAHLPWQAEGAATRIHFIDVGQGDAVLIEQDGEYCLIDTGLADAREELLAYLDAAGVRRLRLLVLTHPHADHIGNAVAVMEAYAVDAVLLPDFSKAPTPTTTTLARILQRIADDDIPTTTAAAGQTFGLGQGTLTVLGSGVPTEDYNDISIALRFDAQGMSYVACGDASTACEDALLDSKARLAALLFKASHHGSYSANSEAFLRKVHPMFAVVSCGAQNDYHLPNRAVLNRFAALHIQVLRTDERGSIIAYVDETGTLQLAAEKEQ